MSLEQQNTPDLFANMQQVEAPQVSADLGNNMWKQVGEGIDALMNNIIEGVGNVVGAVVTKGPGALMAVAGSVTGVAAAVGTAPFKHDYISPSNSREHSEVRAPDGHGKSLAVEAPAVASGKEVSHHDVSEAHLCELQPAHTPNLVGPAQGQGFQR